MWSLFSSNSLLTGNSFYVTNHVADLAAFALSKVNNFSPSFYAAYTIYVPVSAASQNQRLLGSQPYDPQIPTPEPASLILFATGAAVAGGVVRRKLKK